MTHYIWKQPNWFKFNWDEGILLPILSDVRMKQGALITKIKSLKLDDSHQAQAEILIEETIKTAAIEGEVYDISAVRSSVVKRLGIATAGLPTSKRHIDGLVQVLIDATQNYDQKLTLSHLKSWQAALFPTGYSGLRKIKAGEFRDDKLGPMQVVSGSIGKEKIHYQAPPA